MILHSVASDEPIKKGAQLSKDNQRKHGLCMGDVSVQYLAAARP